MHPRRTRGVRRASAAGVAIVLAAGLVGCSEDDDAAADPPPESTSTATDEAGGDETDAAERVPELPPEAQGDDDAAAVAFVEHWVELVNYAFATGDTGPARELSASCTSCNAAFDDIEGSPSDPVGWEFSGPESVPVSSADPDGTSAVVVGDIATGDITSGVMTFGLSRDNTAWEVSWLEAFEA